MCIEVYSPTTPVVIPFESEVLRFSGPREICASYCFLLRNEGQAPLNELVVLYPRPLFLDPRTNDVVLRAPLDLSLNLPESHSRFESREPGQLALTLPDPADPANDREALVGAYNPNPDSQELHWAIPGSDDRKLARALAAFGLSAWKLTLRTGIPPKSSRWFWWGLDTVACGTPLPATPFACGVVLHKIISPRTVHRLFRQQFSAACRAALNDEDLQEMQVYLAIQEYLGLSRPRQVNIEQYELTIQPGKPSEQIVLSWNCEGKLESQLESPRLGFDHEYDPEGEVIFDWRSGSILSRDGCETDKNWEFTLSLVLAHRAGSGV